MSRQENSRPKSWFALTVKPRHEKAAAQYLDRAGLESFLPLYSSPQRWSDRIKIVQLCLFPGYVFCRFERERRMDVLKAPSVLSIVSFAGKPVVVPDHEIDAIRTILASGDKVWPWPYLKTGQRVRIERGALAGVEGILSKHKNAWRVVVSIELLQRSVAVEIDRELVLPIG